MDHFRVWLAMDAESLRERVAGIYSQTERSDSLLLVNGLRGQSRRMAIELIELIEDIRDVRRLSMPEERRAEIERLLSFDQNGVAP